MKTLIIASYNGEQKGFTVRNHNLEQVDYVDLEFEVNGIAVGTNSDVFLATANKLNHYQQDGTLIKCMEFPDTTIKYTNVIVAEDKIIASYSGSQKGFTVRNRSLEETHCVETDFEIKGLTTGANGDLFLISTTTLYHYKMDGTLVNQSENVVGGIEYTDVTIVGSKIVIAYAQHGISGGFTVMNKDFPQPNQGGFSQPMPGQGGFSQPMPGQGGFSQPIVMPTNVAISGIVAGANDDVFFVGGNQIAHYSLAGGKLSVKAFDQADVSYNSVSALVAN
ncbi:MAG: hypothetical protein AB8E82_10745 [Aureispira sp.]